MSDHSLTSTVWKWAVRDEREQPNCSPRISSSIYKSILGIARLTSRAAGHMSLDFQFSSLVSHFGQHPAHCAEPALSELSIPARLSRPCKPSLQFRILLLLFFKSTSEIQVLVFCSAFLLYFYFFLHRERGFFFPLLHAKASF